MYLFMLVQIISTFMEIQIQLWYYIFRCICVLRCLFSSNLYYCGQQLENFVLIYILHVLVAFLHLWSHFLWKWSVINFLWELCLWHGLGMTVSYCLSIPWLILLLRLSGLTIQANMYYKMLISWTSQKIKETYSTHNAFEFKNGL